ncbi:hypothetical protein [Chitinimonas sp. BJYL2]|uniref:hypothetical protein n=1 Tax=Chitinimonas sp. BJYL2 TaxID=2976696 RepID=UPI0022B4EC07|nr:hypothetical protein [Chitinimonas sp. BJYL2]
MTRAKLALLTVITLIIGFVAGVIADNKFMVAKNNVALETRLISDVKVRLHLMRLLRNSESKAAWEFMATLNDGDIEALRLIAATSSSPEKIDQTLKQAIAEQRISMKESGNETRTP